MFNFIVYDKHLSRVGLLQHWSSVQWLENYQKPGEVKIVADITPDNLSLLVKGNRIFNEESDTAMKISEVEIFLDEKIIIIRGEGTAKTLDDRVVRATENIRIVSEGMYWIFNKHKQGLPILSSWSSYPERTETQITWGSILEAEMKLAEASGLGFKVKFDSHGPTEVFKVYKGTDRSNETSQFFVGALGTDIENIQKVEISTSHSDYKNVAVVAGGGEGANREVVTVVTEVADGEERRELYVDARDLQRQYQKAIPTGEIDADGNPKFNYETSTYTDEEYQNVLKARGLEKLTERAKEFSITCDVTQNNLLFGTDYFLGDRMPIKISELNIRATALIVSALRIYEKEGKTINVTLGEMKIIEDGGIL